MATVIDALLVTLGLDSSGFQSGKAKVDKGLKETGGEAEKAGKKLKQSGKDASDGFKEASASAAKFLALIGGTMAIKSFISQQIEANAALDRLSKNLGVAANTVSAFGNAAEQAGGSTEGLQGTMDMLSKSQTELMLTGNSSLIPYFSALGLSMADATGRARPVNDLLLEMADRFGRMDRTTANNMGRAMGLDQGTMNLLIRGRSEVEAMVRKQKEYNAVSDKQAETASRLRRGLVDSRQSFEAFGRELLERSAPALEKILSAMSDFGDWCRDNQEFVETFLKIMAVGLVAVGLAVTPINLTVAAVTALAAGIALLWNDYQTWKRGGESLIDWAKWEPGITAAKNGIRALRDFAADAFYRIIASADGVWKALHGDFEGAGRAFAEARSGNTPAPAQEGGGASSTASPASSVSQARLTSLERKYGIPSGLLDRMWATESGRGKNMLSPAGAQGHFQFMPGTAAQYGLKNPNDFDESSDAAARYLSDLNRQMGGDWTKTVAAYNWGPGNVMRKGLGRMPAETRNYVSKLLPGGIPSAGQFAAGAGVLSGQWAGVTNSIGTLQMTIQTQATDAEGIMRDAGNHTNYLFPAQANGGLN